MLPCHAIVQPTSCTLCPLVAARLNLQSCCCHISSEPHTFYILHNQLLCYYLHWLLNWNATTPSIFLHIFCAWHEHQLQISVRTQPTRRPRVGCPHSPGSHCLSTEGVPWGCQPEQTSFCFPKMSNYFIKTHPLCFWLVWSLILWCDTAVRY